MGEHKILGKAVNKLRRVGGSFVLVIPMNYVKTHELENGDSMEIFFDEILRIEPVKESDILKKVA